MKIITFTSKKVPYSLAKSFFIVFVVSPPSMTMADVLGQYGASNRQWQRSVAPREALVVLYWAMHANLQWRICMVFEMASKPCVFFVYFFHRQLETQVIK